MQKKSFRFHFIYLLGLVSLFSLMGGSCDQQLKYITLTPENPTISPPGTATGVRTGQVNATASLGAISGSSLLTVSSATLQSILVTPVNPTIPSGLSTQFAATGHYSDGTDHDLTTLVTWSSTAAGVSGISPLGKTLPAGPGATTITASLGGMSGSTLLTLDNNNTITLNSVTISASTTIPVGMTQQFTAIGNYSDGNPYDVTSLVAWSSSTPSVAAIDSTGLATAGSGAGVTTISASLGSSPVRTGSSSLTVITFQSLSIAVTPAANTTIPGGRSLQFTATGTYTDTTGTATHDISSQVIWTVDSPANVFVNNIGLATAIGPANATSTVFATTTLPGTSTTTYGNATLVISPATIKSITVTPANATIPAGAIQKFIATANYSDGSTYDVTSLANWGTGAATNPIATMLTGMVQQFRAMGTYNGGTVDISSLAAWSSSLENVAKVYPSGYALALRSGPTQISATHDGITATTTLSVSPEVSLDSVLVTPANLMPAVGFRQQYTATGLYHDGSMNNLTPFVTWSSTNTNVAVVNTAGLVTCVGSGTARITADIGGISPSPGTLLTVH